MTDLNGKLFILKKIERELRYKNMRLREKQKLHNIIELS